MRKTKPLTRQSGTTEEIPAFHAQLTEESYVVFAPRPKSTGNDTCARINSALQFTSAVMVVEIPNMGICKVLSAIQRGDWLDLRLLNNKGEEFVCPVLWHTRFDFYFGTP